MTDWAVGISTGCFYQTSIFDCLERIRAAGFCMLEICSFPAHLDYRDHGAVNAARRRLEELGMEAYSFHAPFADSIDITSLDRQQRRHAEGEILRAAEAAATMEVRHFIIHPGPEKALRPEPGERLERMGNAAELLERTARRCRELGIRCVLENMLPHLLFGNTRDMLWMMGAIDELDVGTCLDTGHAFLSGDIRSVLFKLSGHLEVVHANDNKGQRDDHLAPGSGDVDWLRLVRELAATGFDGGIVLELAGGEARDPEDILAGARRARTYLRKLGQQVDLASLPTADRAYGAAQGNER